MARVRVVEIHHFRGIKSLRWLPSAGINCLIGPGDSGKTTVLDAIDLCLGARRNVQFTDADFHALDISAPISISVTIGELEEGLKELDGYGLYLRSFDDRNGAIEDEPEKDGETVLTINLSVSTDLEPVWTLRSERAAAQGVTRNLSWADRVRLAPTRIGAFADNNLSWRRGSVLNLLSEERPDASAALVKAARDARAAFGDQAEEQLGETLDIVAKTAKELGIPFGKALKALLDTHSVSFSGGTISLHDEQGVPLRGLGLGSVRLLTAALQRKASKQATIVLVDELEHGLEPHRIMRLLSSLGAKEKAPPLQAFVTTHSPVAVRELTGDQLFVIRRTADTHVVLPVGTSDDIQSTVRLYPEAFLASTVVVCEGASEVGLLRGLDLFRISRGYQSLGAMGVALVDGNGITKVYPRALAFLALGYRVMLLRDSDVLPKPEEESLLTHAGGKLQCWRIPRCLEDELFASLSLQAVALLLNRAIEVHGESLVDDHIKSASGGAAALAAYRVGLNDNARSTLARASCSKKAGWFKSVTWMESAACDIVGPALETASDQGFSKFLYDMFMWLENG
ncbi:MAG: AAA family ATPase [Rhizomicrobium sp.]